MIALDLSYYSLCYYSKWIRHRRFYWNSCPCCYCHNFLSDVSSRQPVRADTHIARETWKKVSEKNNKFNEILEKYKKQKYEIGNILKDIDISKTRIELEDKRC